MINLILLITFLFLTILFSLVNITRIIKKDSIPAINMYLWAIGITGLIVMKVVI